MTLVEHLEELRHRLFVALGATAVGSVVGWFLYSPVLSLLRKPFCDTLHSLPNKSRPPTGCKFVFKGVMDPVVIKLKVVVFLGLFLALPVVLGSCGPSSCRASRGANAGWRCPSCVVDGALRSRRDPRLHHAAEGARVPPRFRGVGFVPLLTGDRFLGFVMLLSLAFGLSFEFPVVLVFG